jgi:hypothetical protein
MSCNHEVFDEYDEIYDVDEEGNMLEIRNYICRDCGLRGTKTIVHGQIKWADPNQTKLF